MGQVETLMTAVKRFSPNYKLKKAVNQRKSAETGKTFSRAVFRTIHHKARTQVI